LWFYASLAYVTRSLLVCGFMLHWPMLQGRCWFVVLCFTGLCYKVAAGLWFYASPVYIYKTGDGLLCYTAPEYLYKAGNGLWLLFFTGLHKQDRFLPGCFASQVYIC
jgi:hypothetical protein